MRGKGIKGEKGESSKFQRGLYPYYCNRGNSKGGIEGEWGEGIKGEGNGGWGEVGDQ